MSRPPVGCWTGTTWSRHAAKPRGGVMRVAMVAAPREVGLIDAPMPTPGPGEALVRVKAVGLCGSDLQYYAQGRIGDLQFTSGHILGHEVARVVAQLGPGSSAPAP